MLVVTRWLWTDRGVPARLARLALAPPALVYRAATATRRRLYARGRLARTPLPVPTISVGNLTVGGSGKTPLAGWIAGYYLRRGIVPGILLRGYGADEGDVLRDLAPGALVVENPDRVAGAATAVRRGARLLVLDDAFQRLDVARDLDLVVVSAESSRAVRSLLPAGPWREPWTALRHADLVVVTRKRADHRTALAVAAAVAATAPRARVAVARLGIAAFRGLHTGAAVSPEAITGRRVLVSAGIGDPDSLAAQCAALGARVRLLPWPDHHAYTPDDVDRLLHAQASVDYVVITAKDAVKLTRRWPAHRPEPLVATLDVAWERGSSMVQTALDAVASPIGDLLSEPSSSTA